MISINELYQELKNNNELRSKFLEAYGKGEIEGFLKDNDCDATADEALKYIEQETRSGSPELSDEELSLVAGGKGNSKPSGQPKYQKGMIANAFVVAAKDLSGYYDLKIIDIIEGNGVWKYRLKWPAGGTVLTEESRIQYAYWK